MVHTHMCLSGMTGGVLNASNDVYMYIRTYVCQQHGGHQGNTQSLDYTYFNIIC